MIGMLHPPSFTPRSSRIMDLDLGWINATVSLDHCGTAARFLQAIPPFIGFTHEVTLHVAMRIVPRIRKGDASSPPQITVSTNKKTYKVIHPILRATVKPEAGELRVSVEASHDHRDAERALRFALAVATSTKRCLMVHGAGLALSGRGIVFCGVSGAGKTTACQLAPPGWQILSDEHIVLQMDSDKVLAHATPFFSEDGPLPGQCKIARISDIFFLNRGKRGYCRLGTQEVLSRLLRSAVVPGVLPEERGNLLSFAAQCAPMIRAYSLSSSSPDEVWDLVASAMDSERGRSDDGER